MGEVCPRRCCPMLRGLFSLSRCGGGCADHGEGNNLMNALKAWLRAHEEAQVMVASVLVVVGLWWLVRTILALLINLICPLFVVLVAVALFRPLDGLPQAADERRIVEQASCPLLSTSIITSAPDQPRKSIAYKIDKL